MNERTNEPRYNFRVNKRMNEIAFVSLYKFPINERTLFA